MKLKEIQRSGVFAWSPNRTQTSVAIASTQQQFDANSSNDGTFEVHNLSISEPSLATKLTCSKNIGTNSFNGLCWHDQALIASSSNKLCAYDDKLILTYQTPVQTSSMTCLSCNSNTLASGNKEGIVDLWDVKNGGELSKTMTLRPSGGANDEVNTIRWNNQVQSILASSSNSSVQVWDMRKSENSGPIMRVHDSNAASIWGNGPQSLMISQALSWSHSQATTLVVANSNDANPILQVWDLRYATCPIKNLKGGHNRGIVSISWNRYDDGLLLTAGKDNIVCVWSPLSAQNEDSLLAIVPNITNQWIHDIEWCNWEPSLFAVSSFDGNTSIYDITQTNSVIQANEMILESFHLDSNLISSPQLNSQQAEAKPLLRNAPLWFRKPCGASWGFGGKLVCYENITSQAPSTGQSQTHHVINIKQVACDPQFVKRVENLENTLANDNLIDFCHYKMAEKSSDEQNEHIWRLVSIHMETDSRSKSENILNLLGFQNAKINAAQDLADKMNSLSTNNHESQFAEVYANNGLDITGKPISSPETEHREMVGNLFKRNMNIDMSGNSLISMLNQSILTENTSEAIERCIKENAWSEAFLFCFFIDPDSLNSTLKRYLSHCSSNGSNNVCPLLWSIIALRTSTGDQTMEILGQLIANTDLECWREILAFIIRELSDDSELDMRKLLIDKLTASLVNKYRETSDKNWLSAGLFCCVLNGNYKNLVYFREIIDFMNLIEMLLVLQKACGGRMVQLEANALTSEYAYMLAREGKLDLAVKYVKDDENDLKNRIVGALNQLPKMQIQANQHQQQFSKMAPAALAKKIPTQNFQNASPYSNYTNSAASIDSRNGFQQPISHQYQHQQASMSSNYNYPTGTSNFQQAPFSPSPVSNLMPNTVAPQLAPPIMQPNSSTQFQQQTYGNQNQMENTRPQATPGWNDPPLFDMSKQPSKTRHDSFSNRRTPHVAPIVNQMPPSVGQPYNSSATSFPSMGNSSGDPYYPSQLGAGAYNNIAPPMASSNTFAQTLNPNIPSMPMPAPTPPVAMMTPSIPQQMQINQSEPMRKQASLTNRRNSSPLPIPIESLSPQHQELFKVFEQLYLRLQQTGQASQAMNMKRKLEDVRIKLDALKAKLASESGLSPGTMQGLNAIASCIYQNDIQSALQHHQHLVASSSIAETVAFLPAIKVMLHLAQQHQQHLHT